MNLLYVFLAILISDLPAHATSSQLARTFAAKADISSLGMALDMFQIDCGSYPSKAEGFNALVSCPTNTQPRKWKGPYIKNATPASMLLDPWGHPYVYIFPGIHNINSFDLYSCGQDGISKSRGDDLDDINNWDKSSPRGGYDFSKPGLSLSLSILLVFVAPFVCVRLLKKAEIRGAISRTARRKWEGILSLVWIAPGFLACEVFNIEWWRITESGLLMLFIIFGAWWGYGALLAIFGFKSGARIGLLASLITSLCFGYFLLGTLVPHICG